MRVLLSNFSPDALGVGAFSVSVALSYSNNRKLNEELEGISGGMHCFLL